MNFRPRLDLGETGISASREAFTTPAALMARLGNPVAGSRIAWASVAAVRGLGFDVVAVPLPDDPGHAEIRPVEPLADRGNRQELAALFEFVPLPAS